MPLHLWKIEPLETFFVGFWKVSLKGQHLGLFDLAIKGDWPPELWRRILHDFIFRIREALMHDSHACWYLFICIMALSLSWKCSCASIMYMVRGRVLNTNVFFFSTSWFFQSMPIHYGHEFAGSSPLLALALHLITCVEIEIWRVVTFCLPSLASSSPLQAAKPRTPT